MAHAPTRVLFVCHGNICRSTMAQFVFEDLVRKAGRQADFVVDSAATSTEELGRPPHKGTVRKLREMGVPLREHRARQLARSEYGSWDHIVYMDDENEWGLRRILGATATGALRDPEGKCSKLLSFVRGKDAPLSVPDVADPWYTGDFDATYRDVLAGCTAMLEVL